MLKIIKEAYDEEEERNIYELARTWDGDNRHDELEDWEWQEVYENYPDIYIDALKARYAYVKDQFGEMPPLVWDEMEYAAENGYFGDDIHPSYVIDNILVNGDYGSYDDYKHPGETDEEFEERVEDECYNIFPEDRFVIFSL